MQPKCYRLCLRNAGSWGSKKAIVTCEKVNIASAKTIIKGGGVRESEVAEENGNIV